MMLTKSHFKQVVMEYLLKEEDLARKVQDNEDYLTRLRLAVSELYGHYRELNADIDDLRIDLNDYMSTGEKPSRFAEPDVIPGRASMSIDTNPGGKPMMEKVKLTKSELKKIIKEELDSRYEKMYEKNDASELRLLYNEFVDSLRDTITWHSALIELDERIRDKIESIEIRLNELAK
tara:strand:+ start:2606 stop:3136 length:531 start_codon:yes stop_codon:yes gene_type:complete